MARLRFRLKVDGLADDVLMVHKYQGVESLSDSQQHGQHCYGFRYHIQLASRRSDLTALDLVDKTAQLEMWRDGLLVQRVHGIVRQFSQGNIGHRHTFYGLTLVPALERLSLRHNSRIFQLQTAPDIIATLLEEMGITDYAFSLQRDCAQREFCVQYRETDLAFLHRLAAEEGLVYHFIHEEEKHTLLFTDDSQGLPKLDAPIPFNALAGGVMDSPYISAVEQHTQSHVSHTALQDYSFKKPSYSFAQQAHGQGIDYQRDTYEHFDAPGRFKDDVSGNAFNQIRLEYLRRDARTATGKSNHPALQAGAKFDLQDHLAESVNRDWVVVHVQHEGNQPQVLEEEGGSGATTYSNQFTLIPAEVNWRATPQVKPQVDGPCIAMVVGPENEEIFCDEHGRVKLHFPWDRYSNGDEHSSCWVRVSQGWAGSQYGMMAIPRVGHEVIVSFLNGDPDQPIVTGRTYHATNQPPYPLPEHKTKTVLRSETHQGEGFNELSFEDQAGQEKIYLHAQKDVEGLVLNDATMHIKHDKHLTVENDQFSHIHHHQHLTVDGERRLKVGQDQSIEVGGALQQKVATLVAIESGREISLKAGAKIVVEAGAEITLKAGGSFIKVDGGGVHLVGAAINLNSGGSPGSASRYAGQLASAPRTLVQAKPIAELVKPDITSSMQSGVRRVIDLAGVPTVIVTSSNNRVSDEPVAEKQAPERMLKSDPLKSSDELERLAKGQVSSYRRGNHSEEVKLLQQALMELGFDLGKAGADGDFGGKTKTAIERFQKSYQPSHQTHRSYSIGPVDGIVGKGTLLALDEALMDGWSYERKCNLMIDHEFIQQLEGSSTIGYVPEPDLSQSGVTIATGFDLGARSEADLNVLGLPDSLVKKLSPYLGLKKYQAVQKLKELPLSIDNSELLVINELVKKSETDKLINRYNSSSSSVKFECLPPEAQTVIASVAYQYGDLARKTGRFWKQAIEQNWIDMYDNLMDFEDGYPTRRKKEAMLIKVIL